MKKIIAFALTLVLLCSAATAFAEAVPSKTTDDLSNVEVTVENPVEGKTPAMAAATEPEKLEAAAEELAKLQAAGSVEGYFGEETAKAIAAIVGEGAEASVDEFLPVTVLEYDESMGEATIVMAFATPFENGEKVAVLIGLCQEAGEVEWSVYEGVGTEDGRLQFTVPADAMVAIMDGTALLAVVK